MKDFIYDGNVRIFYGAGQTENVVRELMKLGRRLFDRFRRQLYSRRSLSKAGAGFDNRRTLSHLPESRKEAASQQGQGGDSALHGTLR